MSSDVLLLTPSRASHAPTGIAQFLWEGPGDVRLPAKRSAGPSGGFRPWRRGESEMYVQHVCCIWRRYNSPPRIRAMFSGSVFMNKSLVLCALSAGLLLSGCQSVNTTSGGAVGVERKQYMFSMLSTDEVNQMYAQSYQKTVGEASTKGVLDKTSAEAKRVQAIADRLIAQAPVFRPDSAQW